MMYIRLCLPKMDHALAKIFFKTAKKIYGDKFFYIEKMGISW